MREIFERRSIRSFTEQRPEREKIELILRAAMNTPSAGNQQAWRFIVIENEPLIKQLIDFSPYAKPLTTAKTAIVVLGDKKLMGFPEYWEQDLGACCQNLWLECEHLGLGTVWLGCCPLTERMVYVSKLLKLDETLTPFAVFPVGYSAEKPIKAKDYFNPDKISYIV